MVVITPKMNLLQIPIIDEFYVPPSDPLSGKRGVEFAAQKGLFNPKTIPFNCQAADTLPSSAAKMTTST